MKFILDEYEQYDVDILNAIKAANPNNTCTKSSVTVPLEYVTTDNDISNITTDTNDDIDEIELLAFLP